MIIMIEFLMEKGIYMCNKELENIVKEIYCNFHVELSICEVFERRWSYICGTKNFIGGKYKINLNKNYGIIINCKEEALAEIEKFISEILSEQIEKIN